MGSKIHGNYGNPCLTMHQPWASLLVYGIKRVEGRSWPAPIRGRLWIHAASKIPDPETIKAMEDFYKEIYAVNGITDLKFPEHYPVSRLLGCVEVVGCVKRQELACWEKVPEGVRLEGQTDFCWLCENPQKLINPFEMRGFQGVYNLERKIYEAAIRGLSPVKSPFPVKFPLPDPRDPFSLKPGSVISYSRTSEVAKPPSLTAAIAGARAAATQFTKKEHKYETNTFPKKDAVYSIKTYEERRSNGITDKRSFQEHKYETNTFPKKDAVYSIKTYEERRSNGITDKRSFQGISAQVYREKGCPMESVGSSSIHNNTCNQASDRDLSKRTGASSKIFIDAVRGLRLA